MRPDRAGWLVFLTLAALYLLTFGGHFYSGDGIEMARTAESLVQRGSLALHVAEGERGWGYPGRHGLHYAPYPLGQSLAEAPFVAAASALTSPLPIDPRLKERLRHAATVSANIFISAGIGWLLFLFGRRLGYDTRLSAGLAFLFGLGTMAWVYARHDFADPLTGLALTGSALLLRRWADTGRKQDLALSGCCLGFSLFTKYQMAIYCPVIWIYMLALRRQRGSTSGLRSIAVDTLLLAAPAFLFGLADLGVNWIKFGALFSTGYEQEASPWAGLMHIPAGLYGFLLSPGKSLFLYNPLLLLWPFAAPAFHRGHRAESLLAFGVAGVTLLFFSPLYWWHGDWAWGPRYLYPALPFLVLSLAPFVVAARERVSLRRILVVLVILAIAVNLLGMTVNFFFYLRALSTLGMVHDDWNFIPGLSPIAFHAHVIVSGISEYLTGTPIDYVYRAWSDGRFEEHVIPMARYSWEGKTPDYFFFKPYDTALERLGLSAAGLMVAALCLFLWRALRREFTG